MRPRSLEETAACLTPVLTFPGLPKPDFAVAAPIVCYPEEYRLLIEVRASGISQAGDPCFPGGRIEPGETPRQAAARELREELGITPACMLGQLPTVNTWLGSRTDVFVCLVTPEASANARPNPGEVAVLLQPKLEFYLCVLITLLRALKVLPSQKALQDNHQLRY